MRWKPKPAKNESAWHRWFAWYPVSLSDTGETAWLERVWRRCTGADMNGPSYEYELDLGEERTLPPERLVPHLQEYQFRAKQNGHPVVCVQKGGLAVWVHPNGTQEDVAKRSAETMSEAVEWAEGYPEKFKEAKA